MSAQTMPGVYETFKDVFGRKSSMEELIVEICKYERSSILWICAEIVCRVQLWARPALHNRRNYLAYLQDFFEPSARRTLIEGSRSTSPVRLVFNRRQIGLVAKLALKHCGNGLDARDHRSDLGVIFLMSNDQLDHGLLEGAPKTALIACDTYIRLVTEMVAVQEGASPDIANVFTRGHLMLTRYAQELAGAHDFVDVAGEFERKIGLSLVEFEALVFAIHSRFGPEMSIKVVANPDLLPLKREDFARTAVTPDKVDALLKFVSVLPDELKMEIIKSDNGANDATPFRKYPMVQHIAPDDGKATQTHIMIDNLTFLEKAQNGPYWVANEANSENLRTFWGAVFERYVNDLLGRACSGTNARFFSDPRQDGRPEVQICDGLLASEDAVVLMEYKASMFRADSKYRGDKVRLLREIEKKWVHNEKGSKKGVEQLAAAVRLLFDGNAPQTVFANVEWSKIRRVHLCLVTLDSLGETIGMSALLNTFLSEALDFTQYPAEFISPLHCASIASIERATAYFDTLTFPEILSRWLQVSPDLMASLSMVNLGSPRQNSWIHSEWEAIGRQIVPILFPDADMDQFFAQLRENYERTLRAVSTTE
jgi:hypothetical protein